MSAINSKGYRSALGIQEDIRNFTFQIILHFIFKISLAHIILNVLAFDFDFVKALMLIDRCNGKPIFLGSIYIVHFPSLFVVIQEVLENILATLDLSLEWGSLRDNEIIGCLWNKFVHVLLILVTLIFRVQIFVEFCIAWTQDLQFLVRGGFCILRLDWSLKPFYIRFYSRWSLLVGYHLELWANTVIVVEKDFII